MYIMNRFYTQTLIPRPNVDYRSIWPNSPTDTSDTIPRWKTYPVKTGLWENEVIKKLESCNLTPKLVRVFRWLPNTLFPWHIDGNIEEQTEFAINWVCEGQGIIQWDSKIELELPPTEHSQLASRNKMGSLTDPFEEAVFGNGCIVNTTIPHRVVNMEALHRITVSIQFGNKLTYADAVNRLLDCDLIKET
jgi:hypothetical protein